MISFIVYLPVFTNELLEWDDIEYIKDNPLLRSFNFQEIFTKYVMGNYHPVTILILNFEYHFFGLHPEGYHAVNLALHLLNILLVFKVIHLLSNKTTVALIAALLFGIHPLHVESVAWASELKDLLYTFFFLAAYNFYLKYIKDEKRKFYFFALVLFILSILSKAMAASLPVVLLLTDYFKERKMDKKILFEKVPFFIFAIVFGIVAILAQKSFEAVELIKIISFPQRLIFAGYGFMVYLFKLIFPFNLSAYYPYPMNDTGIYIPKEYYFVFILSILLIIFTIYSKAFTKRIIFGIGFYSITIFLVLELLPVGKIIMADRYSYIPSIGIFYLAGEGIMMLIKRGKKIPAVILLCFFSVLFSVKTYARCGVWKNDLTLWSDVINKYDTVEDAYYNRGVILLKENKYDEAFNDFTKAIGLTPEYAEALNCRGIIYTIKNKNKEALDDFNKVININPKYAEAYNGRGYIYMKEGRNDEALDDYNKAVQLKPTYAKTYHNRGNLFIKGKKYDEAINDFNKAIELDPNLTEAYNSRGIYFVNNRRFDEAIDDFNKAIRLKADYAEAYFNRGNLYFMERRIDKAIEDYSKAIEINQNYAEAYNNMGNLYFSEKKFTEAVNYYSKAISLKTGYSEAYFNRGLAQIYSGNKSGACSDLYEAVNLGFKPANEALVHFCK